MYPPRCHAAETGGAPRGGRTPVGRAFLYLSIYRVYVEYTQVLLGQSLRSPSWGPHLGRHTLSREPRVWAGLLAFAFRRAGVAG